MIRLQSITVQIVIETNKGSQTVSVRLGEYDEEEGASRFALRVATELVETVDLVML